MMWDLPFSVEINGKEHKIRNNCDYRVVLDTISALNDEDLDFEHRLICALYIFYGENDKRPNETMSALGDVENAVAEMIKIINLGEDKCDDKNKPKLMDWEHDFQQLVPPVSRILGYDVRTPNKYLHWWSFVGAYMEIGSDCTFSDIITIRSKMAKGKKLEKREEEFYRNNRKLVDLPKKLTTEEEEFLNSDW